MMTILTINNIQTIRFTAKTFIDFITSRNDKIYCFDGEMGVGKTTFIKEICKQLGVKDNVNSPTFSIVNEYITQEEDKIYHFDFYRIENDIEAIDIGVLEYLDSGNYCFIEWAENIKQLIPKEAIRVEMEEVEKGVRMVTIIENETK